MKAIKTCLLKLILCLSVLSYCVYTAENNVTIDVIIMSIVSCRYFAVLCVEVIYAPLNKINYAIA